jgi:hypothetical protein
MDDIDPLGSPAPRRALIVGAIQIWVFTFAGQERK